MATHKKKTPSVVVIGGGNGASALLTALRGHARITAILSPTDDGGSAGWCREEFDMIAPGDFRRALIALSHSKNKKLKEVFLHRYPSGVMQGHVIGNLVLASLFEATGSFDMAIAEAAKLLDVRDALFSATNSLTTLCAELADGSIIRGETNIDRPAGNRAPIKRIFLSPGAVKAHPLAVRALRAADAILLAPGDLYTSLLPSLLVPGINAALKKTKAPLLLFVNIFNKKGETDNYAVSDFVKVVEAHLGAAVLSGIFIAKGAGDVNVDLKNIPAAIQVLQTTLTTPKNPSAHDPKKVLAALKKFGIL